MSEVHLQMLYELMQEAVNEGDDGPFQLPDDEKAAKEVLEALREWLSNF